MDCTPTDIFPHLDHLTIPEDRFKKKRDYKVELEHWQRRLLRVQQIYFHNRSRVIVVFEGADAAGKGGAIRRIVEPLDPRGVNVHAIKAPSIDEQAIHYLYRFFSKLPAPGRIAIFDRSWYGRVLVERVEGFASDTEWQRAYREISEFERWLTDDGVRILKFYLQIDKEEQLLRFEQRLNDPDKYWKLTEEDIRNRQQWDSYSEAANEMFARTSTENSPWMAVDARHKWSTRVHLIKTLVTALELGVDLTPLRPDPKVVAAAKSVLGIDFKLD